jgi:hypothetical protein
MNPTLQQLLRSEWRMLKHRRVIWYYWLLSLIGPTLSTMLMEWFIVGAETGLQAALQRNLWIHNLFLIPLIVVYMNAQSICDDLENGMIRESLLQGHSRRNILGAKNLLMGGIIVGAHVCSALPALLLTSYTPLGTTLLGYLLSWLLHMVLSISIQVFSLRAKSSGTVVLLFVQWYGLESLFKTGLWIAPSFSDASIWPLLHDHVSPYLLSSVLNNWSVWEDAWRIDTGIATLVYLSLFAWILIKRWGSEHF